MTAILVSNMRTQSGCGYEREAILAPRGAGDLERSCKFEGIVQAPSSEGIERIEARFHGNAYAPHRHDTYALGVTLSGVQTFSYRGKSHFSTPGKVIVLHPDEVHDGGAGTDEGLRYRMLYLAPEKTTEAGYNALPFAQNPVIEDEEFRQCLIEALGNLEGEPDNLLLTDWQSRLADLLWKHSNGSARSIKRIDRIAVLRCRDYLLENSADTVGSEELERISGLDRFTLFRHFRFLFGTSPHRYLIMRRLQKCKDMMRAGAGLAETAFACGFADQAHFTRHFKNAFGMPPGRWLNLVSH
ncbi:AraC family transcriptional regulator [Agrobacterium tumefaciens]|uniref:AraC family transcriptional regulator n=1 Tax=Agrobacterium tumefaciens TaxID=358 RepID=A0A4D7YN69_AGRTU|nr:AraC family transcriptional regulator [Agrobacterium tumefaciens]